MRAFYFDVGGVLIPDNFSPSTALQAFRKLAENQKFDPVAAHVIYTGAQPLLDSGGVSLGEFCTRIGASQREFERAWLAMHPADKDVLRVIERLLAHGHSVGLATNFCRQLLDVLIESTPVLARISVCCSSDIGLVKPAAAFFDFASGLMPAKETIFIDDREVNVQAARDFGWRAVHATRGWLGEFEEKYVM